MASKWSYSYVAVVASVDKDGGDYISIAEERWIAKLNEMGELGWELVSESYRSGRGERAPAWLELKGTMKREGAPL